MKPVPKEIRHNTQLFVLSVLAIVALGRTAEETAARLPGWQKYLRHYWRISHVGNRRSESKSKNKSKSKNA